MADLRFSLTRHGVTVERLAPERVVVIRVRNSDAAAVARVAEVLGEMLPTTPNAAGAHQGGSICWLSPGEWMVVGEGIDVSALTAAIAPATGHVADIGEGRVRYRIEGDFAAYVLTKGTSLDLAAALSGGRCAQTLFAQILVLLAPYGAGYEMTADISYAHYLETWFEDATREFVAGAFAS